MAELTKTVDGKALPADKFAYVGDPKDISTWHLPIDSEHIESALKLFGHEKHVPQSAMTAAAKKIAAAAKTAGLDTKNFEKAYLSGSEHSEGASPWIEIFRAGDYRPQGKGLITRNDLERVIRNYDPTYHEAPVCVGHPKDNLPAYGWIERLALDGDTLVAKERQIDPRFDEARKAGRYKKRSAAFYLNASGNVVSLRHVAYLGAQPPEIKGLQDVQFNDSGRAFIVFGEEESVAADEKTFEERMKAFFSEMFGRKQGETFGEGDVKRIAQEAATAAAQPLQTKITELETQLKTQGAAFSEREKQITGAELKQRASDAITKLKSAGKWVPAYEKMGVGLIFAELAKTSDTVEFGEGDSKKQVKPLDLLVEFLEGLPKIVPPGTHFAGGAARGGKTSGDPLTDAARTRAKEKSISFSEALDQVAQEHPELTRPGAQSAGAV